MTISIKMLSKYSTKRSVFLFVPNLIGKYRSQFGNYPVSCSENNFLIRKWDNACAEEKK